MEQVQFKDFNALMNYISGNQVNKVEEKAMNKQDTVLSYVRNGFFIVGSIDANGTVSFSNSPVVHDSAVKARTECKRLAQLTPGKAFMFVKFSGAELVPNASISI